MSSKAVSFSPLNVVLKGKAEDIRAALAMEGMPHYTLEGKLNDKQSVTIAKVLYDVFDPHYILLAFESVKPLREKRKTRSGQL